MTSAGTGVVLLLLSLAAGVADAQTGDDYGFLFGVGFVAACLVTTVWVRRSDVVAAPVCAPLAYAVALAVTTPSDDEGLLQRAVTVATDLAVNADWLYAGTAVAVALALLRHLAGNRRDRQERRSAPQGRRAGQEQRAGQGGRRRA
ncbi:hypothetical protein AQ490_09750 [Wenjunlia vitaminophila]|uniref:DUF6542 domain-containing protein n=1 Tax=Wenjunlia vitaminophila TaxID=76728 RepID=A0A0T6LLP7_WENVI|nr:DUF6542 domain-containing protein [Wenjunlia vitaminophila]KRV47031.1 hypothetical protein AQ490_09750 [Wenjunlia vitaminophila]